MSGKGIDWQWNNEGEDGDVSFEFAKEYVEHACSSLTARKGKVRVSSDVSCSLFLPFFLFRGFYILNYSS